MGRSFAWRSLAVFVAVGALSHLLLSDVVDTYFERALDFHAEFVVETVVAPALSDLMAAPRQDRDQPDGALADLVQRDEQVVGLRITDRTGRDLAVIGPAATTADDRAAGLTETTIELNPGPAAASVVVLQDATRSQADASRLTATFDAVLVVALLVLWAVLLPMANRLGRHLRSRADELERQGQKLQRLLDREHQTVARLEEVSALKDSFLSAISHELRTPLTVVVGSLMTLERRQDELSAELRCDLLSRARRKAVELDELLTGLLSLQPNSRVGARSPSERVDLRELVSEVVAHLPPRRVAVDLEVDALISDRRQLGRVLTNLIGNAIRHAPGNDPITVRSRPVGDEVELVVADRGRGVPDELKQVIFEPFRQGALLDGHSPGTGIGLSLVASFVAERGGRTWVEDRPGGGACFHVRLPRDEGSAVPEPSGREPREWSGAHIGSV